MRCNKANASRHAIYMKRAARSALPIAFSRGSSPLTVCVALAQIT